jgi:hypothetical protein
LVLSADLEVWFLRFWGYFFERFQEFSREF